MKRLALLLLPVFAVLLMSHNVGAVGRIGAYSDFETNSNVQGALNLNTRYNFNWTNRTSVYLRKGHFANSFDWYEGNIYHLVLTFNFYGDSFNVAGNEAIRFESDYYTTENDEVSSTFSCSSTECRYTIIHNITLRGIFNGNYYLTVPESNLISLFGIQATDSVQFMWTGTLFYDDDEWAAVKDDIAGIHSDTTDIVDTLGEINDKLDALDSNADANAQGWENMQNTDDLVNIGDDSQLISIVGTITTVFDSIKNTPMSESCSISSGNTPINMGDINLCYPLPQWVADIGSFVMTTITFAGVFFMLIGCVNAVNKFMDWARHN